ncbi:MAG: hypothetical protein LBR40_00160 [Bacilli bacterium]|jgi:hypothetical protein|nr:hypothetical protein [Bacilli bacterium]
MKERQRIIEAFKSKKPDPNYDVFESKKTPGRYTIRRKEEEPVERAINKNNPKIDNNVINDELQENDEVYEEPINNNVELMNDPEYNPFADSRLYYPSNKVKKNELFIQMQMQINDLLNQNMKMAMRNHKNLAKQNKKTAEKTNATYKTLYKLANELPEIKEEPEIKVIDTPPLNNTPPEPLNNTPPPIPTPINNTSINNTLLQPNTPQPNSILPPTTFLKRTFT